MIEFEKIGDTFEEGFDKVKDFAKKNKVLTIAICGVGAFALYKLFTDKKTSEDTEYVSTYAYVPTGYDGYPTMSESVSYDDVVNQLRTEVSDITEDFYNETVSDVTDIVNKSQTEKEYFDDVYYESESDYGEDLSTMSYLEEQAVKNQMKANSEAWHTATTQAEKDRLHAENEALGASLGASFDSSTGTWSKDGESLYNITDKNKSNTSTAALTNVGVTSSPVNESAVKAQMKANSEAWHTATTQAEKDRLHAENQRLGASIGASYDSSSGSWSNSTGSKLYTVSTGSSTSSGSKTTTTGSGSTSSSTSSESKKTSSVPKAAQAKRIR